MKVRVHISRSYNPFYNLAREQQLFSELAEDRVLLYLWQNKSSVVVGHNQNPWLETRPQLLKKEGADLVRRPSGGGAVYHDSGNLNFSFLSPDKYYDEQQQFELLQSALRRAGIKSKIAEGNGLFIGGRKFSGSAFYHGSNRSYQHGTLLLNSRLESLHRFLKPALSSPEIGPKRGVSSNPSPVINLCEINPGLTVSGVYRLLIEQAKQSYNKPVEIIYENPEQIPALKTLKDKYCSPDWVLGKTPLFSVKINCYHQNKLLPITAHIEGGRVSSLELQARGPAAESCKKTLDLLQDEVKGYYFNKEKLCQAAQNRLSVV